jgi:hypothetical protein
MLLLMSYFGMRLRKHNPKTSMEVQKTKRARSTLLMLLLLMRWFAMRLKNNSKSSMELLMTKILKGLTS